MEPTLIGGQERIKKKRKEKKAILFSCYPVRSWRQTCVGDSQLFFAENKHAKQAVVATSLRNHLAGSGTGNEGEAVMQNETELIRAIDFSQLCVSKKRSTLTPRTRHPRNWSRKSGRDYAEDQLPMQRNIHCPSGRALLLHVWQNQIQHFKFKEKKQTDNLEVLKS